jgi:TonB-dependent SusC/RagA subfamily outer membrane receptor
MKKNNPFRELFYSSLKKILLIMRFAIILLTLGILQSYAVETYSQKTKLSISFSDAELIDVLDTIEAESEFFFLYNEKLLDIERKVNVNANNQLIDVILDSLFAGTDTKYTILDRKIILAPNFLTDIPQVQQIRISGTVIDETGKALPGVTVKVKGTTLGTLTDSNGAYSIENVPAGATLVFSFIGMITKEIEVENRTRIDVTMEMDIIGINEVVVTGYATQTKASLTGSVATIGTQELSKMPSANVVQRLQGRISGVSIINSHVPGEGAQVRVRGLSTINNNDPLYVIDGVPTKVGLSQINPNDISSLTVLKDAASAAIYGASGANGVIIITTIQGNTSGPKISLNARTGISRITKTYDTCSSS